MKSPPHDMNGEDPALVAGEEVIDEVADNGMGLVPELGHDATDQDAGAAMPFKIDHAVRFARAVNLRPAVGTARTLMLGRDELEFFLQLRIAHDLVAQRSAPSGDDLDDRLHSFWSVFERAEHHVNIHKSLLGVAKRARQRPHDIEPELPPQVHCRLIR